MEAMFNRIFMTVKCKSPPWGPDLENKNYYYYY
jgi:hypothetical protein